MNTISTTLLNDTLQLVQLARETARTQGSEQKAAKLDPVVSNLREIVTTAMEPRSSSVPPDMGILGQEDFRTLLSASSRPARMEGVRPAPSGEKFQVVSAMSEGGMTDTDIARHLGMTRDEVRIVLSLTQPK